MCALSFSVFVQLNCIYEGWNDVRTVTIWSTKCWKDQRNKIEKKLMTMPLCVYAIEYVSYKKERFRLDWSKQTPNSPTQLLWQKETLFIRQNICRVIILNRANAQAKMFVDGITVIMVIIRTDYILCTEKRRYDGVIQIFVIEVDCGIRFLQSSNIRHVLTYVFWWNSKLQHSVILRGLLTFVITFRCSSFLGVEKVTYSCLQQMLWQGIVLIFWHLNVTYKW